MQEHQRLEELQVLKDYEAKHYVYSRLLIVLEASSSRRLTMDLRPLPNMWDHSFVV